MRNSIASLALMGLVICGATPALAYKEVVHQHLTQHAVSAMKTDFLVRLGIDMNAPIGGELPTTWMQKGAYDEDDGLNSRDHFFDPVNDSALTEPFFLCAHDAFGKANFRAIEAGGSEFSVYNAKHFYFDALMGPNPGSRNYDTIQLLQAMGHEMHLIQDMAQPEHTRNDQHLPATLLILTNGTAASVWEDWGLEYMADHTVNITDGSGQTTQVVDPYFSYGGYPAVTLPTYYDYFHSAAFQGMADFSNANFVTQDTNYDDGGLTHCFTYDAPNFSDDANGRVESGVAERVENPLTGAFETQAVDEAIYSSTIVDQYSKAVLTDPYHDFKSLLDLETRFVGGHAVFSLGDASYVSRAAYLAPRAVGYSAGFVDHFFRGRLTSTWSAGAQTGQVNITITNFSSETIGPDGKFFINYVPGAGYLGNTTSDDAARIIDGADLASGRPPGPSSRRKHHV
jgi:hypothetical protein